jgi:hypothetical protein
MSTKNCHLCERDLAVEQFNSKRKECKECSKGLKLLARYKITQAQYNQKLEDQGGVCTICFRTPEEVGILVQDHDHSCCPGEYSCGNCLRDLICQYDNKGLGLFQDHPERIRQAASYIELHRKESVDIV